MIARETIVVVCANRSTLLKSSFLASRVFSWAALLFIPRIFFFQHPFYSQCRIYVCMVKYLFSDEFHRQGGKGTLASEMGMLCKFEFIVPLIISVKRPI